MAHFLRSRRITCWKEVITVKAELTLEELDEQRVELLPARETLSYHSYGYCCPSYYTSVWASNQSLAFNVGSPHAYASSAALQSINVG
jgi:hypothetical protein